MMRGQAPQIFFLEPPLATAPKNPRLAEHKNRIESDLSLTTNLLSRFLMKYIFKLRQISFFPPRTPLQELTAALQASEVPPPEDKFLAMPMPDLQLYLYACVSVLLTDKYGMFDAERLQFLPMRVKENLELGSNATVSCRAEGRVTPRLRWSRLYDEDRYGELPDDVYADVDGNLLFVHVRSAHAGRYQCVASSEQGTINITVSVEVVGTSCHLNFESMISIPDAVKNSKENDDDGHKPLRPHVGP